MEVQSVIEIHKRCVIIPLFPSRNQMIMYNFS